jgi:hypothetical protein
MWKICQAFRARYRSFVSDSTRLPRQTTPTKLAVFSFNLGILKTEGKNKSSSSITTVESKAASERPFLLLERPMIRETLPPKSRVAPPTGQSRRCAQVACHSSAPNLAIAPLTLAIDAFTSANESLTHANPSFAPVIESITRASDLPSNQSTSLVTRANAPLTSVNESKPLVCQLPSPQSVTPNHQSTATRKPLKTWYRLKIPARLFPGEGRAADSETGIASRSRRRRKIDSS